jgi:hypothetical protein
MTRAGATPDASDFPIARAKMLDLVFIAATLAFFVLGAAFVHACDRI